MESGRRQLVIGYWQSLDAKRRKLIEVATLEHDVIVTHLETTAATQSQRVTTFEYRLIIAFEQILAHSIHACPVNFDLEQAQDRGTTMQWRHHHLMLDRVFGVEFGQTLGVAGIEPHQPFFQLFVSAMGGLSIDVEPR